MSKQPLWRRAYGAWLVKTKLPLYRNNIYCCHYEYCFVRISFVVGLGLVVHLLGREWILGKRTHE